MSSIINKIKEYNVTNTFILYVDEESDVANSELVCNQKCLHCYYRYSNQKFKTYEKIIQEIDNAISKGADHIQITGGEPTIYPHFFDVLKHIKNSEKKDKKNANNKDGKRIFCSVITNTIKLSNMDFVKKCKEYVDYFLCSCHAGKEETMNAITQNKNLWNSIFIAFENMEKENIEFHINFTIMKPNYKEIKILVEKLIKYKMFKRINVITFNPWESLEKFTESEDIGSLIVSYDEMMPYLDSGLKFAKDNNIEVAVRYFPFCKIPEWLYKYNFNYTTEIVDFNEWNFEMWMPKEFNDLLPECYKISEKLKLPGTLQQRLLHAFSLSFFGFRREFVVVSECKKCKLRFICNQPHKDYVTKFPDIKFSPLEGDYVLDLRYYINNR
jgi:sulfatase maturation enzyme AslB (radical SAM superfamily)